VDDEEVQSRRAAHERRSARAVALAILRRGTDEILVFEGVDPAKAPGRFFRPMGGGIEFGESSRDALQREIREELGVELRSITLLGVLENIFTYRGVVGHEICFVYEAESADPRLYASESPRAVEADGQSITTAWKALSTLVASDAPLYPAGLAELLLGQPP
jgi:ADP-ribose pyrophosphatase YjhB (NUDIX family)